MEYEGLEETNYQLKQINETLKELVNVLKENKTVYITNHTTHMAPLRINPDHIIGPGIAPKGPYCGPDTELKILD